LPDLSNWIFNRKTEKPVTRYKEMEEKPKGKNANNNDGQFPKQHKYGSLLFRVNIGIFEWLE